MRQLRRGSANRTDAAKDEEPLDPSTLDPNALRERVYRALSVLKPNQLDDVKRELITELDAAGINVGGSLFLMGIPVSKTEDLTPLDVAQLIRYVRLSAPKVMYFLKDAIIRLISPEPEPHFTQQTKRAA
jgi:hypothetical protein